MVRLNGRWTEEHTPESANEMLLIVANPFVLEGDAESKMADLHSQFSSSS